MLNYYNSQKQISNRFQQLPINTISGPTGETHRAQHRQYHIHGARHPRGDAFDPGPGRRAPDYPRRGDRDGGGPDLHPP